MTNRRDSGSTAPDDARPFTSAGAGAKCIVPLANPGCASDSPVVMAWSNVPRADDTVFIAASLTDYLDGDLARRWHVVSDLGIFFDLTADKLFVSTILIVMVQRDLIPAWMVIIIISREFIVSGLRSVRGGQRCGHCGQPVG